MFLLALRQDRTQPLMIDWSGHALKDFESFHSRSWSYRCEPRIHVIRCQPVWCNPSPSCIRMVFEATSSVDLAVPIQRISRSDRSLKPSLKAWMFRSPAALKSVYGRNQVRFKNDLGRLFDSSKHSLFGCWPRETVIASRSIDCLTFWRRHASMSHILYTPAPFQVPCTSDERRNLSMRQSHGCRVFNLWNAYITHKSKNSWN